MLRKEFSVDKLKVKVYDNRQAMGQAAGDEAAAYLRELLASQDEVWAVFGAAPSQNEVLAAVAAAEGIDWTRVHALHMDEYVNLPSDAPQGFGNFLRRAIFDKLPFASVEYIGSEGDPQEKIQKYTEILEKHPVEYRCYCSRERVTRALISMGREEMESLIEDQGQADLTCQFCDEVYHYTREDLQFLLDNM